MKVVPQEHQEERNKDVFAADDEKDEELLGDDEDILFGMATPQ